MARIKIEDLPVMEDMGEKELKGIFGGFNPQPEPPRDLRSFGFRRRSIRGIGAHIGGLGQRGIGIGELKPLGKAGAGLKGYTGLE